jgi:AraC-like DNA-binding protein
MTALELDTSTIAPKDRMAAWSASVASVFGPFAISRNGSADFHGRLKVRGRGALRFGSLAYQGHNFERRPSDVARLANDYFTLTWPVAGQVRAEQGGEEHWIRPGSLYLFNHAVPYSTVPQVEYQTVGVAFPCAALRRRLPEALPFYAVPLADGAPRGALLMSFVEHLAEGLDRWDEREFAELGERLIDLIALLVVQEGGGAAADTSVRIAHRERALRYIRAHLADAELAPETVARACGISLSYLHQLFRGSGVSVEELIFAERLEQCRKRLSDPRARHLSVSTIAYQTGFSHPAHFSRSFKRRFGMTPSDARAATEPPKTAGNWA